MEQWLTNNNIENFFLILGMNFVFANVSRTASVLIFMGFMFGIYYGSRSGG